MAYTQHIQKARNEVYIYTYTYGILYIYNKHGMEKARIYNAYTRHIQPAEHMD